MHLKNYKYLPKKFIVNHVTIYLCVSREQKEGWKGAIPKTIIFRHNL